MPMRREFLKYIGLATPVSTALFLINEDPNCDNALSQSHPEVNKKVEKIFREAHEDSEWYTNPGETEEIINQKKQKVIELNSLQTPTKPNSTF